MHLYLHVPFCARRCSYCDFAIAVRREVPVRQYLDAVLTEWRLWQEHPVVANWIGTNTIYLGGGTPSLLPADALSELVATFTAGRPLAVDAEVTLEANPDDVTADRALAWRRAGFNRVSLGVQSHNPSVLEWMHRTHRAEQVAPAIAALRAAGFDNISTDLIFALPAEVDRDWPRDLELTMQLEPDHISLYGLTVEPHTPLARWTARGNSLPAGDDRYSTEYLMAHHALQQNGFRHYEVSNAGRPGRVARHNSAYWSGIDYLGLGPSAHSLLSGVRSWNEREWAAWQHRATAGESLESGREILSEEQRRLERLYLGLRTDGGLESDLIAPRMAEQWLAAGWAEPVGSRIRLTVEGWLRLDALVMAAAGS